jgi:hypothetical protein
MTQWQTRRDLVTKNLTMWLVFRIVDGVEEVHIRLYDTQDEAIVAAQKMNGKEGVYNNGK